MRDLLLALMETGLSAADAGRALGRVLGDPPPIAGRIFVLAAGKAAGPMAAVVEAHWGPRLGHRIGGLCVVPDGHGVPLLRLHTVEAAHPLPDQRSVAAGRQALDEAARLGREDLLLALVSGGTSALLCVPAAGIALAQKQRLTAALLKAGLPIAFVNAARRRLSAIKGGRLLAAAHPARVLSFLVSDVPGDDPAVIGSGPTVPPLQDPEGLDDAARAAGIALPKPAPFPPSLGGTARLILRPADMLAAVGEAARGQGFRVHMLGDRLEGDAEALADAHAGKAAHALAAGGRPLLLSGGEASVRVTGTGRGGRNGHFLLALALALESRGIAAHALAIDSDGIDGNSQAAGALLAPHTLGAARAAGLDPRAALLGYDSFGFWTAVGGQIRTGPTRTNLNDLRIIIPEAPPPARTAGVTSVMAGP